MRRALPALALLALASCASRQASEAARLAPGHTLTELKECAGLPAHSETEPDGETIVEWTRGSKSLLSSLPVQDMVASGSLPISTAGMALSFGDGDCTAIAVVREGRVVALNFAGADGGISGRHAACAPIVRGCAWLWGWE